MDYGNRQMAEKGQQIAEAARAARKELVNDPVTSIPGTYVQHTSTTSTGELAPED
jgi:hypothetical protein